MISIFFLVLWFWTFDIYGLIILLSDTFCTTVGQQIYLELISEIFIFFNHRLLKRGSSTLLSSLACAGQGATRAAGNPTVCGDSERLPHHTRLLGSQCWLGVQRSDISAFLLVQRKVIQFFTDKGQVGYNFLKLNLGN